MLKDSLLMNQCIFTRICLYLPLFCLLLFVHPAHALGAREHFKSGDYFNYDIYWSFLKVGSAKLEISHANSDADSEALYNIRFSIQSNALINKIYPVESIITSSLLIEEMKPLLYTKKQNEGEEKRDIQIQFDWERSQSVTLENGLETNIHRLEPSTLDPLSLILAICNYDFKNRSSKLVQKVTDGGSIVPIEADFRNTKLVHTKAGSFESNKIEVTTKQLKGVFNKSPNSELFLYLSQDDPAILLKLESKVIIGSFNAVLSDGVYKGTAIAKPILKPNPKRKWIRGRFR